MNKKATKSSHGKHGSGTSGIDVSSDMYLHTLVINEPTLTWTLTLS